LPNGMGYSLGTCTWVSNSHVSNKVITASLANARPLLRFKIADQRLGSK
jgi:hypothetical protein